MKEILKFVQDFSKVRRWSQIHCTREESSLEHTAAVALIALKIGTSITIEVNTAELLTKALLHDMEETITGDIMTPVKYANPEITAAIKKYEKECAAEVSTIFGSWSYYYWENSKDDSIEGQIIKIADKASVVYKYRQEIALGNTSFLQYEENIWNALHQIKMETPIEELHTIINELMDILQEKSNENT
jgi:5'-deoxynucleotidase YfbR-like HD superfamily hydrolase